MIIGTASRSTFTWHKDVYSGLLRLILCFSLLGFISAHVIPGVCDGCVVDEESGSVVSWINEGVLWQWFSPDDVAFTRAAYVEHGMRLQDKLVFVGHDGWRGQSRGDCKNAVSVRGTFTNEYYHDRESKTSAAEALPDRSPSKKTPNTTDAFTPSMIMDELKEKKTRIQLS